MEENKKHIDDWFREGLQDYRETPDASVWNALEQRLPKEDGRKRFLWLWVLLMLALLSSLGYYTGKKYFSGNKGESTSQTLSQPSAGNTDINIPSSEKQTDLENDITKPSEKTEKNKHNTNTAKTITASSTNKKTESSSTNTTINSKNTSKSTTPKTNNTASKDLTHASDKLQKQSKSSTANTANKNPSLPATTEDDHIKNTNEKPENNTAAKKNTPLQEPVSNKKTVQENNNLLSSARGNVALKEESKKDPSTNTVAKNETKEPKNIPLQEKKTEKEINKSATQQPTITENKKSNNSPDIQPASASNTEKKASLPSLQESKEKSSSKKNANRTEEATKKPSVALQEKPEQQKTIPVASNNTSNKPIIPKTETANGKPININTEKAEGKPINVASETAKGKPVEVTSETAKGKLVNVTSASNGKPPKVDLNAKTSKVNPLLIEPAKDYGIKIADYTSVNDDEGNDNNDEEASSGGGGGGATSPEKTKRNKNGLKLDAGLKLGYERGTASTTTNTFTGNLFLQWNISQKIALIVQPGIRYSSLSKIDLFSKQSFHEIIGQSLDSAHVTTTDTTQTVISIQRNYIYQNQYDSVVASFSIKPKQYVEIELPLLLQYKVADNFSLLLGGQLAFGKIIEIGSSTKYYKGGFKTDTVSFAAITPDSTNYPNVPSLTNHFSYNTPAFSTFDESKYKNPITNPARFGIMLGFSYELKKKILFDLMVRKNISSLNFIPNEEVRKIYNQPYFRITVGYKLFNSK